MTTATSSTGMVYNFTYDDYGNNTAVSITGESGTMSSSATYTNGDLPASTTDALGNITTYGYNTQNRPLWPVWPVLVGVLLNGWSRGWMQFGLECYRLL